MNIPKNEIEKIINKYKEEASSIALNIWNNPEKSGKEFYASKLISDTLKKHLFKIKSKEKLETHVIAKFGNDNSKKKIAILGEYDALKGTTIKESIKKYAHGCGHNLLGAGSLLAVISLKELIIKNNLDLQIVYYGCPAEEEGAGKCKMIKKGMFENIDACFTWHPASKNSITNDVWIGSKCFKINFFGKEAHASMNAINSINANNLMVQVINFINKIKDVNLSYIINNNDQNLSLVPKNASMDIAIRSFDSNKIKSTYNSILIYLNKSFVKNTFEVIELDDYPITRHDKSLQKLVYENFKKFNKEASFSKSEFKLAEEVLKTINKNNKVNNLKSMNIPLNWSDDVFNSNILYSEKEQKVYSPTDVGAVSAIIPTIQFQTICMPLGISVHTKEATIFTGNSVGLKGMILAAKVLTSSVIAFYNK